MHTSDSEGFESADEEHVAAVEKKGLRRRKTSSNYSDNALETDSDPKLPPSMPVNKDKDKEKTDGWDDFDVDNDDEKELPELKTDSGNTAINTCGDDSQDTGWVMDDWGYDYGPTAKSNMPESESTPSEDIDKIVDRLSAACDEIHKDAPTTVPKTAATTVPTTTVPTAVPSGGSGWGGWGWGGVDSLLSTATAGITSLTNQVSQGITNVLETGIGVPEPEEMARRAAKVQESKPDQTPESDNPETTDAANANEEKREGTGSGDAAFEAFGSILKFVGSTGSKVISGGLDTLETIGRKTMEVLQDGDPQLARKRALLGLDSDKPNLSQVLREAKDKAEEEDKIKEVKREAKEIHYESLFDDFEGLVHLEALEMLSKQVNMRIEERLRDATDKQDMKETLQQVAELCELPEEGDDTEDEPKYGFTDAEDERIQSLPKAEAFHERMLKATRDMGVKLQLQPLFKQYEEIITWLSSEPDLTFKVVNKRAISALAQATALSMQLYHKAAESLLVRPRRATADEADSLTQMTAVLTKHTSELATVFTEKLQAMANPATINEANDYITNIFLEAHNSSEYIQTAFLLTQPIVQIGAI